jgi:hypothetical protein
LYQQHLNDQHVLKELKQLNELTLLDHHHHLVIKVEMNIVEVAMTNKGKLVLDQLDLNFVVVMAEVVNLTVIAVVPNNNKQKK